jgi:hypothetical protein
LDFGFGMNEQQFKDRTRKSALAIIAFVDELPRARSTDVITGQLLAILDFRFWILDLA